LWEKAIDKLSEEDRKTMTLDVTDKMSCVRDAIKITKDARDVCSEKQWKFNIRGKEILLRDVAEKLLSNIDKFAEIGTIITTYEPHSAVPWAAFQFLLKFAISDIENMARMLEGSETAARTIDRCAIFERLYLDGQNTSDATLELETCITDLYTSILTFQARALKFFRTNTAIRHTKSIFDAQTFKDLLKDMSDKEQRVERSAPLVEAEFQRIGRTNQATEIAELKLLLETLESPLTRIDQNVTEIKDTVDATREDIKSLSQSFFDTSKELQERFTSSEQERLIKDLPVAREAAFNSARNIQMTECLPETRVDILKEIETWSTSQGHCIYWLNGMAGTGKSTVARTIARMFAERKCLAASFFFTRGGGDVSNAKKFVTTIAYQLTHKIPAFKPYICEAIDENPDIFDRGVADQWNILISQPFAKFVLPIDIFLVIDALDECDGEQDARLILQLLSNMTGTVQNKGYNLRTFITSRPDTPIRREFGSMSQVKHRDLILQNVPKPIINKDLARYFKHELVQVKNEDEYLPPNWPDETEVEQLVEKADGLFIYATTTMLFIRGNEWSIPASTEERLSLILKGGNVESSATSQLDDMYLLVLTSSILSHCSPKEEAARSKDFKSIIGCLVILFDTLDVCSVSRLFDAPQMVIEKRLNSLRSILDVPEDKTKQVRFLHQSFRDFLLSSDRCTNLLFQIESQLAHSLMLKRCLGLLSKVLKEDICNLKHPGSRAAATDANLINQHITGDIRYALRYWVRHLESSSTENEHILADNGIVHSFFQHSFLYWLEALSLIGALPESIGMILKLRELAKVPISLSQLGKPASLKHVHNIMSATTDNQMSICTSDYIWCFLELTNRT